MCFSRPKAQELPPAVPPPPSAPEPIKQASDNITRTRDNARRRAQQRSGLLNTNKTGGTLATAAAPVATKTLLGQ